MLAVLGVLVLTVAWFASRVIVARVSLENAQALVTELRDEAASFDLDAIAETGRELERNTARAASAANDPTWRVAEIIPVLGPNLSAVRAVADSTDALVGEVAEPAIRVATTFDLSKRDPATGGFDLAPLKRAETIAAAAPTVRAGTTTTRCP